MSAQYWSILDDAGNVLGHMDKKALHKWILFSRNHWTQIVSRVCDRYGLGPWLGVWVCDFGFRVVGCGLWVVEFCQS